jgi:hypothetical protein
LATESWEGRDAVTRHSLAESPWRASVCSSRCTQRRRSSTPAPGRQHSLAGGPSAEARQQAGRDLYLEFREGDDEGTMNQVAATGGHCDHRRAPRRGGYPSNRPGTCDAHRGFVPRTLRVWWAEPIRGHEGDSVSRPLAVIGSSRFCASLLRSPTDAHSSLVSARYERLPAAYWPAARASCRRVSGA